MIFHTYLSSVVFQLQRFYPKTWLLWFQQQMDLEMLLPSISSLFHNKLGDVDEVITVLLALVLAYLIFILIAFTYIPLHISFVLRVHYFASILLLHHRAHIITFTSLQFHHHTYIIKLTSILFHKISVSIECCILPTSWQYKSGAQTPILLFQLLTPLQSGSKE